MFLVLPGPRQIGYVTLDIHTLLYGGGLVLVGAQGVFFAVLSKVYAITHGLMPQPPEAKAWFRTISLEHGMIAGVLLVVMGTAGSIYAVTTWARADFGPYNPQDAMRLIVPSVVALALGAQTIFSSFFLSLLGMPTRKGILS